MSLTLWAIACGGEQSTAPRSDAGVSTDAAEHDGQPPDAAQSDASAGPDVGVPPFVEGRAGNCMGVAVDGMVLLSGGSVAIGCDPSEHDCGSDKDFPSAQPLFFDTIDDFAIDRYEVTRAALAAWAATPPSFGVEATDDAPATDLTRELAQAYCESVGKRLPTWGEWEAAARGPTGRKFPWGDTPPTCARARYSNCGASPVSVGTHPFGASACGVHDLAGNAAEWTQDRTFPNWGSDAFYYFRGGSWKQEPAYLVSYVFAGDEDIPHSGANFVGFRCARNPVAASNGSN